MNFDRRLIVFSVFATLSASLTLSHADSERVIGYRTSYRAAPGTLAIEISPNSSIELENKSVSIQLVEDQFVIKEIKEETLNQACADDAKKRAESSLSSDYRNARDRYNMMSDKAKAERLAEIVDGWAIKTTEVILALGYFQTYPKNWAAFEKETKLAYIDFKLRKAFLESAGFKIDYSYNFYEAIFNNAERMMKTKAAFNFSNNSSSDDSTIPSYCYETKVSIVTSLVSSKNMISVEKPFSLQTPVLPNFQTTESETVTVQPVFEGLSKVESLQSLLNGVKMNSMSLQVNAVQGFDKDSESGESVKASSAFHRYAITQTAQGRFNGEMFVPSFEMKATKRILRSFVPDVKATAQWSGSLFTAQIDTSAFKINENDATAKVKVRYEVRGKTGWTGLGRETLTSGVVQMPRSGKVSFRLSTANSKAKAIWVRLWVSINGSQFYASDEAGEYLSNTVSK